MSSQRLKKLTNSKRKRVSIIKPGILIINIGNISESTEASQPVNAKKSTEDTMNSIKSDEDKEDKKVEEKKFPTFDNAYKDASIIGKLFYAWPWSFLEVSTIQLYIHLVYPVCKRQLKMP